MTNPKSRIFAAVVGALSMSAAVAWAEVAPQDQKIRELEAKVAALETKQAAASKEMAATVDAVLRDAEKRSQMLATSGDMGAGYDNGFYIRAGDSWVLRPGAQFQFRHVVNYREEVRGDVDNDDDDDDILDGDVENGFEVSRMMFELGGTAFSRDLEYYFDWNSGPNTGGLVLEDAWAKYMFADDWGVRGGQFRDFSVHEWNVSEKRQMAVDRTLLNEALGGGMTQRTQGASLIYGGYNKNNPINAEVAITDGIDAQNTNFLDQSVAITESVWNFGIVARVEWKAMGNWASYRDFTAKDNKEDLLVFGAGGDWSQSGSSDFFLGTLDAQWETTGGLALYGAFIYRYLDAEEIAEENADDWGAMAQVAYLLNPSWELFGRYDFTRYELAVFDDEDFHELTIGVNYYLGTNGSALHRAKFTVDLSYLPNGSPRAFENIGVLGQSEGDDEWMLRAQFQLLI